MLGLSIALPLVCILQGPQAAAGSKFVGHLQVLGSNITLPFPSILQGPFPAAGSQLEEICGNKVHQEQIETVNPVQSTYGTPSVVP